MTKAPELWFEVINSSEDKNLIPMESFLLTDAYGDISSMRDAKSISGDIKKAT
jgi:hypothetical protein